MLTTLLFVPSGLLGVAGSIALGWRPLWRPPYAHV